MKFINLLLVCSSTQGDINVKKFVDLFLKSVFFYWRGTLMSSSNIFLVCFFVQGGCWWTWFFFLRLFLCPWGTLTNFNFLAIFFNVIIYLGGHQWTFFFNMLLCWGATITNWSSLAILFWSLWVCLGGCQ
jgi:hypothetical protein